MSVLYSGFYRLKTKLVLVLVTAENNEEKKAGFDRLGANATD